MTFDPSAMDGRARRLVAIVFILLAGIMTGAQLGKIAPLISWYSSDIGLSLVATGWLAAVLGIFIAIAALPSGWVIDRIGLLHAIALGVAALSAGGALLAVSGSTAAIFAARLVEAIGYLALCVALPAALNAISLPSWKGPVLAIWSGFVPLGFAVSDFLASALLPVFTPTVFLFAMTAMFLVFSMAALALLRGFDIAAAAGEQAGIRMTLSRDIVLLALGFGSFVVLSVSMFTFMPAFVAGEGAHYLVSAGAIALSVPAGNVIASVLVRGRDVGFMARLGLAGFVVSTIAAVPAFTLASPLLATASAFALAISGAVVASAQFAAIPFLTPRRGSVSVALGLVSQAGGIGTLFGPPMAAWVTEIWGWSGFSWFLAATALAGVGFMLPLCRFSAAERLPHR